MDWQMFLQKWGNLLIFFFLLKGTQRTHSLPNALWLLMEKQKVSYIPLEDDWPEAFDDF